MNTDAVHPGWRLERDGANATLHLFGSWLARETGLRDPATISRLLTEARQITRLHFDTAHLDRWDSALIVFLQMIRQGCTSGRIRMDEFGLPEAARRLRYWPPKPKPCRPPGAVPI